MLVWVGLAVVDGGIAAVAAFPSRLCLGLAVDSHGFAIAEPLVTPSVCDRQTDLFVCDEYVLTLI